MKPRTGQKGEVKNETPNNHAFGRGYNVSTGSGGALWYRAKRVHVVLLLASALAEIQTIKRRAGLAPKKEATTIARIFWIQRDGVSSRIGCLTRKPLRKAEPLGAEAEKVKPRLHSKKPYSTLVKAEAVRVRRGRARRSSSRWCKGRVLGGVRMHRESSLSKCSRVKILDARPKLNALLDGVSETLQTLDTDLKAAILAAPDKPETLEETRGSRTARAREAGVWSAESECSAAFGCSGKVPLEMFESNGVERGQLRVRRRHQVIARPIVPAIFQRSAAAWLGVDMPSVGAGDAGFVVLGTSVSGGPKAKSAAADEQAGAFVVTTAQPRRITGSFKFTQEDAARLAGMEDALTMNLSSVLSDALDNQALNGSGSGDGTINGLLAILTNPSAPASNARNIRRDMLWRSALTSMAPSPWTWAA